MIKEYICFTPYNRNSMDTREETQQRKPNCNALYPSKKMSKTMGNIYAASRN